MFLVSCMRIPQKGTTLIIKLTVPTPADFLHGSLFAEVATDLFGVGIQIDPMLGRMSVAEIGDGTVTIYADVAPGAKHAGLTQDEIQELAQSAVS